MNKLLTNSLFLMFMAFMFSFGMRLIWYVQFADIESFSWNGQLMINTNDGYYFASAAKNLLDNGALSQISRLPIDQGLPYLTFILAKFLPFSLETIILFMPAIISSLVVIPIFLLLRLYDLPLVGFLSALLASTTWSFYNRTMLGYYDTDMFSVLFPLLLLYGFVHFINKPVSWLYIYNALVILLYPYMYSSAKPLLLALCSVFWIYLLAFRPKEKQTFSMILLTALAMAGIPIWLKVIAMGGVWALNKIMIPWKVLWALTLSIVSLSIISSGSIDFLMHRLSLYTRTDTVEASLHFYGVIQTIREAGHISFAIFANRMAGSIPGLILGVLGYLWLIWDKRVFLLGLPLWSIGFFALTGGLRFTVYAVPFVAIGAVYAIYRITSLVSDKKVLQAGIPLVVTVALLYPNVMHIVGYRVPTVLNVQEVQALETLRQKSKPGDFTMAWWDYGYPIWFYSHTDTLIDGGKHQNDNFIVSQILTTSSQRQAANLSRVAVEAYVNKFDEVATQIFSKKVNGVLSPQIILDEMEQPTYVLPKSSRDIFLYLPLRMFDIFPTIQKFSSIDLLTGIEKQQPFFYQAVSFQNDVQNKQIYFGNSISFDQKNGTMILGKQTVSLSTFCVTQYDAKGKLRVRVNQIHQDGALNLIFMKNYNRFLLMDKQTFESLFVQLFVFENYDNSLFEPTVISPYVKIYKIKQ